MPDIDDVRCAILAFHKIGEPPLGTWRTWSYVPTATFVGFLELLAEDGWQVIDLETLLAGLGDPSSLPRRSALLTFDDGYRSMLTVAAPCLARFGHPAVVFVPTAYVGATNRFDIGSEPEEPLCTWEELVELERQRVSVQSHSVQHRSFDHLDLDEQVREIVESKTALDEHLDQPVRTLSFPFGASGGHREALRAVMRGKGYAAAFRYHGGVQRLSAASAFELSRVPVGPDTDLRRQLQKEPR